MNYGLTMNFSVNKLVNKLKKNRKEHAEIITEAKKNYLLILQSELSIKLKTLEKGDEINPNSKLPIPGDNLEDYDTAISMLEFTVDKNIKLTQAQYHCYVEDKWSWQKNFLSTCSDYSELASSKLISDE